MGTIPSFLPSFLPSLSSLRRENFPGISRDPELQHIAHSSYLAQATVSQYGLTVDLPIFQPQHSLKSLKYRNLGSLPSADDRHSRRSCVIVHAISNPLRFEWASFYGSECGPVAGPSNQIRNDPVMLGDLCQLLSRFPASRIHAALASFYRVIFPCPPRSCTCRSSRGRYSHYED